MSQDKEYIAKNQKVFEVFFWDSSLPMVMVDSSSYLIVDANPRAQTFLGLAANSFKGEPFSSISAIDHSLFNEAIKSFFEKGYSGLELPFRAKDGRIMDIELHFTHTELKHHSCILFTLVDVTERNLAIRSIREGKENLAQEVKQQTADLLRINNSLIEQIKRRRQAEEELRQREKRFRSMIEHNSDIIIIINSHGKAKYLSPSISKELGYSMVEGRYPNVLAFVAFEERVAIQSLFKQMRQGQLSNCTREVRVKHKTGVFRTFEFTANNLLNEPSVQGIVVNARDITDRIIAREEIKNALDREQELSRQKTQFLSTVSHEFRTPLSNISLNIQLLAKYIQQNKASMAGQSIKRLDNAVKRLTTLLNEASLISKDQSGRLQFSPERVDSHELINYLLDQFSYLLVTNVILEVDRGEQCSVMADKKLIGHILSNLLGNALKFSPDKQEVHLTIKVLNGNKLYINIKDSGIGIPKEEVKFLFDPYFRASNVKHVGGTGLGLSIVKRCVDLHEGEISIASDPGQGTEFLCVIPLY